MNYGIITELNNNVGWYPLSLPPNLSYLVSDRRVVTTLEATVYCHTFERQESDCSLQQRYVVLQGVMCVSGSDFTGRRRAVSSPVQMSFFPSGQLRFSGPQKYSN
jgi:hypothetical protein